MHEMVEIMRSSEIMGVDHDDVIVSIDASLDDGAVVQIHSEPRIAGATAEVPPVKYAPMSSWEARELLAACDAAGLTDRDVWCLGAIRRIAAT